MLRITVEIENPVTRKRRLLASGAIGNQGGGEMSDYVVALNEIVGSFTDRCSAEVKQYPRFATSVWDLVARSILTALYGSETLPERPVRVSLRVPVQQTPGGLRYVRIIDLPYPAANAFDHYLNTQPCSRPIIEDESFEIAYFGDLTDFLDGSR